MSGFGGSGFHAYTEKWTDTLYESYTCMSEVLGTVSSPWQRMANAMITPANAIVLSPLLEIEEIDHAQHGYHLELLPPPQELARAPYPHPAYPSIYPLKEQTLH